MTQLTENLCLRNFEPTNTAMTIPAKRVVSYAQNGVGAFVQPCKRMEFYYCDWGGSSLGMRYFSILDRKELILKPISAIPSSCFCFAEPIDRISYQEESQFSSYNTRGLLYFFSWIGLMDSKWTRKGHLCKKFGCESNPEEGGIIKRCKRKEIKESETESRIGESKCKRNMESLPHSRYQASIVQKIDKI